MYADDTVLYAHGKTAEEVAQKLTKEIKKVSLWLKNSCLTLNLDKTVSMFFRNRSKIQIYPNILIEGQIISNQEQVKYLGVILEPNLGFKKHIKKLSNTIKFNMAQFRYIRNSLTIEASGVYLNAMIVPHFRYCMTSWSQATKTALKPLESLYKTSLKIHDQKSRRFHHCHILVKYQFLSFENLIIHTNLCLMYKILYDNAAPPLKEFISLGSETTTRATRSTVRGECRIPKRRTAFGNSAFSGVAARQWNMLPTELFKSTSSYTFTRQAKKWLLLNQFCSHM
jgi:hypothetical protein